MDYTGSGSDLVDQQDSRMSDLRQPLVSSVNNSHNRPAAGSDQTMLSNDPAKRISAQISGGLNRRQEVEMTQFERPVLDIEGLNSANRRRGGDSKVGLDISEEMLFNSHDGV